jgi:hypothetical protein
MRYNHNPNIFYEVHMNILKPLAILALTTTIVNAAEFYTPFKIPTDPYCFPFGGPCPRFQVRCDIFTVLRFAEKELNGEQQLDIDRSFVRRCYLNVISYVPSDEGVEGENLIRDGQAKCRVARDRLMTEIKFDLLG